MPLATFSALLDFAIEREKSFLEYIAARFEKSPGPDREILTLCKSESEKHLKSFQTILRENVTELVMEPYEAVNPDDFLPSADSPEIRRACRSILTLQCQFLKAAARVITLKEVKRALENIVRKKEQVLGNIPE